MAQRVFLHIGAPKTGSTYIQNVLWGNADTLRDRAGVLVPHSLYAHDQAMADLRGVAWHDPDSGWTWDRLAAMAVAWPGDVVISSEGLGAATSEQAARAVASLGGAEVHIIVAGRDLWRTLPSMWQQSIRGRSTWRFEDFLSAVEHGRYQAFWDEHTADRMLRRWGDLVPPTQRHLITVPPAGAPHDTLWQRFAGVTGIPDGLCTVAAPTANVSLGAAEVELLRRVNQALGDLYPHRVPYQRVVQKHLVDAVLKQRANALRFGIGADRAAWVMAVAEQQIETLRAYPCQVAGDLEELRPVAIPADGPTPDQLPETKVLEAAIDTIVGMLGHAESLDRPVEPPPVNPFIRLRNRAAGGVKRRLRNTVTFGTRVTDPAERVPGARPRA
ncbi:hypothetical protein Ade02nite_58050 [Paractinoplanes deccanensis]|uniref:Sulfotransferase family protein n=1 Tax=Paractinoplanes deccanensis TaxID=113561 RepID=A0ABQ3YAX8_9ACTN|nr:hypothetical protein Ade02nite_58050 [Actinoplanes deccanensis]